MARVRGTDCCHLGFSGPYPALAWIWPRSTGEQEERGVP